VGEDFLEIELPEGDRGGEEGGESADGSDGRQRCGVENEERAAADYHIDARSNHRGCMDERAHRGGAFHGIRKPDMKRELSTLSEGAEHQEEGDPVQGLLL